MKQLLLAIAVSAISITATTAAQAATFVYQLGDHPDRALSGNDYGLRLDRENDNDPTTIDPRFLSFDNGADVTLTYDSVAGTALIAGLTALSDGAGGFDFFEVSYSLSGLVELGTGGFIDTVGLGSGTVFGAAADGSDLSLGASAKPAGTLFAGEYFRFGDDALSNRAFGGFEGTGWVQSGPGANDFLFTAVIAPVPLPAAAWMLLAGLGGLGAMRRRQTKS